MSNLDLEALWSLVESVLDELDLAADYSRRGRNPTKDRDVLAAYAWIVRTGAQWSNLPREYPSRATCFRRLKTWREADVFTRCLERVMPEIGETAFVDATFIRARSGGDDIGLTRHGKGCVLQVIVNETGEPGAARLQHAGPGERSMLKAMIAELDLALPAQLIADAGYDANQLSEDLASLDCELIARPSRSRRDYVARREKTRASLKKRWIVEALFSWLANWRGTTTRYAKTLHNHAQATWLALTHIILKKRGNAF